MDHREPNNSQLSTIVTGYTVVHKHNLVHKNTIVRVSKLDYAHGLPGANIPHHQRTLQQYTLYISKHPSSKIEQKIMSRTCKRLLTRYASDFFLKFVVLQLLTNVAEQDTNKSKQECSGEQRMKNQIIPE